MLLVFEIHLEVGRVRFRVRVKVRVKVRVRVRVRFISASSRTCSDIAAWG